MGSDTTLAPDRAAIASAAAPTTALVTLHRAPIARLRPPRSDRSRHVENVAAPQPERTRRLPLDQIPERERDALRLAALRLLPEPDHLVPRELSAPARERDRLHHRDGPAQGEPARLHHLAEHEEARPVDLPHEHRHRRVAHVLAERGGELLLQLRRRPPRGLHLPDEGEGDLPVRPNGY